MICEYYRLYVIDQSNREYAIENNEMILFKAGGQNLIHGIPEIRNVLIILFFQEK